MPRLLALRKARLVLTLAVLSGCDAGQVDDLSPARSVATSTVSATTPVDERASPVEPTEEAACHAVGVLTNALSVTRGDREGVVRGKGVRCEDDGFCYLVKLYDGVQYAVLLSDRDPKGLAVSSTLASDAESRLGCTSLGMAQHDVASSVVRCRSVDGRTFASVERCGTSTTVTLATSEFVASIPHFGKATCAAKGRPTRRPVLRCPKRL